MTWNNTLAARLCEVRLAIYGELGAPVLAADLGAAGCTAERDTRFGRDDSCS